MEHHVTTEPEPSESEAREAAREERAARRRAMIEARMADALRVLTVAEVAARLGVHRVSLYRYERAGLIPPRRQIGPGRVGWLSDEIEAALRSRPVAVGSGR